MVTIWLKAFIIIKYDVQTAEIINAVFGRRSFRSEVYVTIRSGMDSCV